MIEKMLETSVENGREERLQIFGAGTILHSAGDVVVDAVFVDGLVKSLDFLRARYGYLPPLTAEHPEMMGALIGAPDIDGVQYGLITGVETDQAGAVYVQARLNKLGAILFELGALTYFSPSIYREWVDPHSGLVLGPVLREVSAVAVPHNKNISAERIAQVYSLSEDHGLNPIGFAAANVTQPEEVTGMEEKLDAILELLSRLISEEESEVAEDVEAEAAPEMAEAEEMKEDEMAEDEEVVAMAEKVAKLEAKLKRSETIARVRDELPALDAQTVADLAEVRMSDEARYKRLVAMIPGQETRTIGTAQAAPAVVSMSEKRIANFAEEAAAAGVPRGVRFIKFLQARGLTSEEINTALADDAIKSRIANAYAARGN